MISSRAVHRSRNPITCLFRLHRAHDRAVDHRYDLVQPGDRPGFLAVGGRQGNKGVRRPRRLDHHWHKTSRLLIWSRPEERVVGKGHWTEITRWLVNHAFRKLAAHRVTLKVHASNERALALYRRVGFVEEGRVKEYNWDDGKWFELVLMVILDKEWDTQRGAKQVTKSKYSYTEQIRHREERL
ncbi:acyl-CoA N-acyltransferase [Russula brevipes]|nr:acyl-CoA N-acyltransferase [Russula brevipes]